MATLYLTKRINSAASSETLAVVEREREVPYPIKILLYTRRQACQIVKELLSSVNGLRQIVKVFRSSVIWLRQVEKVLLSSVKDSLTSIKKFRNSVKVFRNSVIALLGSLILLRQIVKIPLLIQLSKQVGIVIMSNYGGGSNHFTLRLLRVIFLCSLFPFHSELITPNSELVIHYLLTNKT